MSCIIAELRQGFEPYVEPDPATDGTLTHRRGWVPRLPRPWTPRRAAPLGRGRRPSRRCPEALGRGAGGEAGGRTHLIG